MSTAFTAFFGEAVGCDVDVSDADERLERCRDAETIAGFAEPAP